METMRSMRQILTITEVNRYIKEIFSQDLLLSQLWLKGEISNFKHHYSGHMYFTLKDEKSLIKCVMFKSYASGIGFTPENGMKIVARGYISVFERDGQYQLYVEEMQPDGLGSLYIAFEQLKKKLQDEGLFDSGTKKELPYLPKSIGVITSSTGAVIKDIINVTGRRFPNIKIKVYPVLVQGPQSAQMISKAIRTFNRLNCVDLIILARGGGSLEELWPFNEEVVARSIFESEIPLVSAVGHETDFTIADFTADVRASTPSAAAELAVPEKKVLAQKILDYELRLQRALIKNININKVRYERLEKSIAFRQPYNRINQERIRLDNLSKHMNNALSVWKNKTEMKMTLLMEKLDILSPLNVLSRGYSIVKSQNTGKLVKSVEDIGVGDTAEINLKDGFIYGRVLSVLKRTGEKSDEE